MKSFDFKEAIIFENDNYLIINKPPHISTLDERTLDAKGISIIRMVKKHYPDAQIAHRLDKETSGALAVAKNPEAYRHLAIQFEKRQVEKIYHAVSTGIHDFQGIMVDLPILPLPIGIVKIDRSKGKEATTIFNTKEVFKKHTLVECMPLTGRMHQIRIHISCLGASIVSDVQYGGKMLFLSEIKRGFNLKKDTEEQPLISRVALHAYSLAFKDLNDEIISATAPYPKDMNALLKQLRNNL
ncbi:RluA family pseudouridine synthase [Thermoflexibacter ruber]|uniref:23S rRNA pseudouridine955/2504/2580 synthase n=1 Tax=Thermoflexibacter ruber TaxID=1003 RepID=A0A1I2E8T9_9BACT|nr:pseudouridine synthase [Thermoflexibacter ruber]SFE89414.1 23S rRNA pseudouridine955/2504/2580 synthase [Thermoflexibacter ruber]